VPAVGKSFFFVSFFFAFKQFESNTPLTHIHENLSLSRSQPLSVLISFSNPHTTHHFHPTNSRRSPSFPSRSLSLRKKPSSLSLCPSLSLSLGSLAEGETHPKSRAKSLHHVISVFSVQLTHSLACLLSSSSAVLLLLLCV
jgi:hypothetical protein